MAATRRPLPARSLPRGPAGGRIRPIFLLTVLLVLLLAPALGVWPAPARGAQVRSLLVGPDNGASERFARDLQQLWAYRNTPTPERLRVRVGGDAAARLREVRRGRAHFAVVDVAAAARELPAQAGLAAVVVLWPRVLHAVTRNTEATRFTLPPAAEVWVLDPTSQARNLLAAAAGSNAGWLLPTPPDVLMDALQYAETPLLVVPGPVGMEPLREGLSRWADLRLLAWDPELLEALGLERPWLVTHTVRPYTYPGQTRQLELPARHEVLVARRDLSAETVRKMLETLYPDDPALLPDSPLFNGLEPRLNAVFAELFSFHPTTAEALGFAQEQP